MFWLTSRFGYSIGHCNFRSRDHIKQMQNIHEFSRGDSVEWRSGAAPIHARRGRYEVVQQLPENASGELQYRIRSAVETSDRVVSEIQLASRVRVAA
jgi:hypothetical protein